MKDTTLIGYTLTRMSEKKNTMGQIASLCLATEGATVANQIASTIISLYSTAQRARKVDNKPEIAPEICLNFLQNLMNQNCWAARRLMAAQMTQEQTDELQSQANGTDFSQELAEDMGELHIDSANIGLVIESDYDILARVHSWAETKIFNYLTDVDEFHMYADREQVENLETEGEYTWEITNHTDNWAATQALMQELLIKLAEEAEGEVQALASDAREMDFAVEDDAATMDVPEQGGPVTHRPDLVAQRNAEEAARTAPVPKGWWQRLVG